MRIEITRIVADWLLNGSYGVNHFLPLVPRDAGDPAPPQIAAWVDPNPGQVAALAIFDDTRHPWVMMKNVDTPATPALWVAVPGSVDVTGEPWPNGDYRTTTNDVQLAVGYVTAEEDLFVAVRDGDYTLRAVVRSLRELMLNANVASRVRNNVRIDAMQSPLSYLAMNEVVGASRMAGGILISLRAEDGTPSY